MKNRAARKASTDRAGLMDVRQTRLSNGIRVVTSTIPHVQSVALGIWVGVGSRYEPGPLAGVSHFLEHMLFKGTKRRSATEISRAIEGRGGYLNAFTQEEATCYYARVAQEHQRTALSVLSDMYLHPALKAKDIDKERGVVIEEIMMYRDQPRHVVHELLEEALWQEHPLGRPVIGSPETLQSLSRRTITDFKQGSYVPRNTVFAFAGRLEHERCVAEVEKVAGRLATGRTPPFRRVSTKTRQLAVMIENKKIEQAHLAMGIRLFGRRDERRYGMRVLSAVLGENMSSRLFQTVRERHGLAYSVHSHLNLFSDTGALVISAGLDRKRSLKALELIVRELRKLKDRAVSAAELKRAKDYVTGQLKLGLESTSSQMIWLGDNVLCYGRVLAPERAIEKVEQVTADDVMQLAKQVIRRSRLSVAMISPDLTAGDKRRVRDLAQAL